MKKNIVHELLIKRLEPYVNTGTVLFATIPLLELSGGSERALDILKRQYVSIAESIKKCISTVELYEILEECTYGSEEYSFFVNALDILINNELSLNNYGMIMPKIKEYFLQGKKCLDIDDDYLMYDKEEDECSEDFDDFSEDKNLKVALHKPVSIEELMNTTSTIYSRIENIEKKLVNMMSEIHLEIINLKEGTSYQFSPDFSPQKKSTKKDSINPLLEEVSQDVSEAIEEIPSLPKPNEIPT